MKRVITLLLAMLLFFAVDCGIVALAEDLIIHFLDVGQADAVILQCGSEVMMIDGGDSSDSSLIYSYLIKTLGITHIDYMIVTHPHDDHIGGLSGKTIIPFATSGGSGLGDTVKLLASSCPEARFLNGRVFSPSASQTELLQWADQCS